jgi:hypothetical protein
MRQVFLIYAQEDRNRAANAAGALGSAGYTVLWDLQAPPGVAFGHFVDETMEGCLCVVVLWTRSSVRDDWVKAQASKARRRAVLVPVLLDDVASQIPLEFSRLNAANLTAWRPGVPCLEWDLFLGAVGDCLGAPELGGAPPGELHTARGSFLLTAAAFAVALAGEYLVSLYFLELRRTGVIALGALWAGVAALGVRAAVKARPCAVMGGAALGWFLAPLGLVIYLYALASSGALTNAVRYHAILFLLVVAATLYAMRRSSAPS